MCALCGSRGVVEVWDYRGRHDVTCPRCKGRRSWWSRFIEWLKGLAG